MKKNKIAFIPPLGVKGLLTWLLLLMLAVSACKKKNADPEPDLPPETQIGADTFGCYLNGVPWKPAYANSSGIFGRSILLLQYDPGDNYSFNLIAKQEKQPVNEWMAVFSWRVSSVGTYSLKKGSSNEGGHTYGSPTTGTIMNYDSGVISDGELVITKIDMQKRFISGRFWFKLEKQGITPINVTGGRFDVTF